MTITMSKYGKKPLIVRMAKSFQFRSGWLLVGYGPSRRVLTGCE